MSRFNQGVREMFKKKQEWMEERLRRLERPQDLPTFHHPVSDLEKDSITPITEGNIPGEP